MPRCKLPLLPRIESPLPNEIEDLACNEVSLHILDKLPLISTVDYHIMWIAFPQN